MYFHFFEIESLLLLESRTRFWAEWLAFVLEIWFKQTEIKKSNIKLKKTFQCIKADPFMLNAYFFLLLL